jgi:exodeoxyribonuclease-3
MFKIATWNVNSLRVRLPHVLQWLESESPDVLAIQETKTTDDNFPEDAIKEAGYHVKFVGQKTYNGVSTICKSPVKTIATAIPGYGDLQKRVLAVKTQGVVVLNLYVPNGAEVNSEKYHYKLEWFSKLYPFIKYLQSKNDHVIVLGDFNIAPEDRDVHAPEKWKGCNLVSQAERNELNKILTSGFSDCFRSFDQPEKSFSWWDYRAAGFIRNHGLRIDLILASSSLAKNCSSSYIDKEPRKLSRPSDHTPVIAVFEL